MSLIRQTGPLKARIRLRVQLSEAPLQFCCMQMSLRGRSPKQSRRLRRRRSDYFTTLCVVRNRLRNLRDCFAPPPSVSRLAMTTRRILRIAELLLAGCKKDLPGQKGCFYVRFVRYFENLIPRNIWNIGRKIP